MNKYFSTLLFLTLFLNIIVAKPRKNTADFYILNADRHLGKHAQLYIEDVTLIGPLKKHPHLTEFKSLTWDGINPAGTANILVDTKDAESFYKKYHSPEGYQRSNSIGTKSNEGWKARRLRCLFVKNEEKLYFYTGNINPFIDIQGLITLKNVQGKTLKCKILGVKETKIKVQRSDKKVFILEVTKLDGNSQRLVRNWQKTVL